MTKAQYLVLFSAIVLFSGLYFGFDTKPAHPKEAEPARAEQSESTSFESLLSEAKTHLSAAQTAEIAQLGQLAGSVPTDAQRVPVLKRLSAFWYDAQNIPVAGGYAEQSAAIEHVDSAWSVVGATFYNGLIATQDPAIRNYCAEHARKAFETASELNPGKVEHRVNLALVYAEAPKADNPMQAVLMLRDMEKKYPESPSVFNALGRLAIKTGQWQRAVDRLEKAWSLDPKNPNTPCLLAKAYQGAGRADKAAEFAKICNH